MEIYEEQSNNKATQVEEEEQEVLKAKLIGAVEAL